MENFDALSLVIISLGAFLLPLIAQRISIPSIVLEICIWNTSWTSFGYSENLRIYIWIGNIWIYVINVSIWI